MAAPKSVKDIPKINLQRLGMREQDCKESEYEQGRHVDAVDVIIRD